MNLDEVIVELYRLAESRKWEGERTDEALLTAIEGMEQIWKLWQSGQRKAAKVNVAKRHPRLWS